MMHLCASLYGKVFETVLMKNICPSLLIMLVGTDVYMSRARSGVRQFLNFVFNECSMYSCNAGFIRSSCLSHFGSSRSAPIMVSGISK
jgi:hypothetical protein